MTPKTHSLKSLLWMARDAGNTQAADRALLYSLILRSNVNKQYSCFPSYSQSAEDTGLHLVTCKKAARKLERLNLISRKGRGSRSNIFFINVGLLEQLAGAAREKKSAERAVRKALSDHSSPFCQGAMQDRRPLEEDQDESADTSFMTGGAL